VLSRKLEPRERRFLQLVSTGSVCVGLAVGRRLYHRGLIRISNGRYILTEAGEQALARKNIIARLGEILSASAK
jgi:hypothetical protein